MKPALFYALRRSPYHGRGAMDVVAVTLERGSRWWGRDQEGNTTNARGGLYGRFATAEEAEAKLAGVEELRANYGERLRALAKQETKLRDEQEQAITCYLAE